MELGSMIVRTPGILGGYRQGITFGASDLNVPLGRYTTSTNAIGAHDGS